MPPRTALITVVFVASVVVSAQEPFDGEWTGSGGTRLVLKSEAAGLTGTVSDGPGLDATMAIEQGSVSGGMATFTTSRTVDGKTVRIQWMATLSGGDTLSLTRMMDADGPGREGRGRAGAERGRGGGRAGRGERGGPGRAGRAGRGGRAGGEGRGRAGSGERGRGEGAGRGRAGRGGDGGARGGRRAGAPGGDDPGGGFPQMLRRVR